MKEKRDTTGDRTSLLTSRHTHLIPSALCGRWLTEARLYAVI